VHALVDAVDVRVVGDRLERDVRHGLVDEAALQPFVRVLQLEVVVAGGHQALLGQRDGHARGVAGDPAAAPFFGDEGCGAGAAGWIEHEVTGVSGHQQAAFALADEGLEVAAVLDAVGRVDVDHLHLPGHALLLQQAVHHQQAVAGDQPVGPAAVVR
jgi:hypothetical protein